MARLIALDTSVIVALAGGPSVIKDARARMLLALDRHRSAGDTVALPAPALAECCHIPEPNITKFRILPFNAPAAILANKYREAFDQERRAITGGSPITKREVSVDCFIMATAVEAKAEVLYTLDDWFEKVKSKLGLPIQVCSIPTLAEFGGIQESIF